MPPALQNTGVIIARLMHDHTSNGLIRAIYFFICARLELFCDFPQSDCPHERAAFTISSPAGQKSYCSDNGFVYKGVFKFFKQLSDNVKVKMFSDDSSHSEREFYYSDELNFLEN